MTRKRLWLSSLAVSVLFVAVVIVPVTVRAEEDNSENGIAVLRKTSKAFTSVAKKVTPAVVSISVEKTVETSSPYGYGSPLEDEFFERFFGRRQRAPRAPETEKRIQQGQGSGFIVSRDGYILTNNHVVGEADDITVSLNDGRTFQAKLIGTDPKTDVAVVKIEADDLPFIKLGDSDALEIGEWVIAVGTPFRLSQTVTVGVVSAKDRYVGIIEEENSYEDFIQTDAAINPGNSGGPLLNLDGEAIGINTAIYSQSGGYMGIGFAVPSNIARNVKDQLIETGKVQRGYIGIEMNTQEITPDLAKAFGLKDNSGVIIRKVIEGTPAEKAGLKSDDVIIKLNDRQVKNYMSFRNSVAQMAPGVTLRLTIVRDGKEQEFKVKIASQSDEIFAKATSEVTKKLGLQVQDMDDDVAGRLGYEAGKGVIVTRVERATPAYRAGIRSGMLVLSVNRKYISSVKEFEEAVKQAGDTVLLLIQNENYSQYVVLSLK